MKNHEKFNYQIMNCIIRDEQVYEKAVFRIKPMRSKCQYTDYLLSFDDTVGIHDKISRKHREAHDNRVASQLVVTHVGNEIFSYVLARHPWYPNRIGMTHR